MADIEVIRRLHEVKGWSIRKIAKELRHSRRTVEKYLGRDQSGGVQNVMEFGDAFFLRFTPSLSL